MFLEKGTGMQTLEDSNELKVFKETNFKYELSNYKQEYRRGR